MGRRTRWEMCDIIGAISLRNIRLSKLCSSSSDSAVQIASLDLIYPSNSVLLESARGRYLNLLDAGTSMSV